jgi:hypothetical protein
MRKILESKDINEVKELNSAANSLIFDSPRDPNEGNNKSVGNRINGLIDQRGGTYLGQR